MHTVKPAAESPAKKRIFFLLATTGLLMFALSIALLVFLLAPRLRQITPLLPPLIYGLGLTLIAYLAAGLTLAVLASRSTPHGATPLRFGRWVTMSMLPITVWLGRLMHLDRNRIQRSFVEVNNALAKHQIPATPQKKILVLLPHCLQSSKCAIRVTTDLRRCKNCGGCDLGPLRALMDEKPHLEIAVATGGEAARQLVRRTRPDCIIAVACERDLTHGICDVGQIPVLGVVNRRPHGPCRDTRVDIRRLCAAITELEASSAKRTTQNAA
jgi:hypothetical protein